MFTSLQDGFRDIGSLIYSIPISRTIYTLVALLVIIFLVRDLISLWSQQTLYLGPFEYYADGKSNPDRASQLRAETVHHYKAFVEMIDREVRERLANAAAPTQEADEPARWLKEAGQFTTDKVRDLSSLELSVQGVNIQKIITYISGLLERSPAITATVIREEKASKVLLDYPHRARKPKAAWEPRVDLSNFGDDAGAAASIACYLIWAQTDEARNLHFNIAFEDFCQWMQAIYLKHVSKTTSHSYFAEEEHSRSTAFARSYIRRAATGGIQYSEAYLASADLAGRDTAGSLQVNDKLTIAHPHLAPYLRYLYLRYTKSNRGGSDALADAAQFYKALGDTKDTRIDSWIDLANAFFTPRITKICANAQDDRFRSYLKRIVRIKATEPYGVMETTGVSIGPGLIIAAGVKPSAFASAGGTAAKISIATLDCVDGIREHVVREITPLIFDKRGIFSGLEIALLKVPSVGEGLKMIERGTARNSYGGFEGAEVTTVGFAADMTKPVEEFDFSAPRTQSPGESELYAVRGYILRASEDNFVYKKGVYFANDAIVVGPGMVGSPLFSDNGSLIGVQVYLNYSGGWWPTSTALPIDRILEAIAAQAGGLRGQ